MHSFFFVGTPFIAHLGDTGIRLDETFWAHTAASFATAIARIW